MIKRLALFLVFLCIACSKAPTSGSLASWIEKNGKVKVLSTTAIVGDLVAEVGGERIDHISLIVGELDPHSYELVKGDAEKLQFADLIFSSGLGLEHGASLQTALLRHKNSVSLGDYLLKTRRDEILFVDGEIDPHVWMDASLFAGVVDPIVAALSEKDPDGASYYRERGEAVKQSLKEADREVLALLESVPQEHRYLVTSHDAFNYFARRYLGDGRDDWQERFIAPEGLAPDGQLSPQHIQEIIDHLKKYQIKVIFPESNVSRDSIKKIVCSCQRSGLEVSIAKEPLYGDALGGKGSGAETYRQMLPYNAKLMQRTFQETYE